MLSDDCHDDDDDKMEFGRHWINEPILSIPRHSTLSAPHIPNLTQSYGRHHRFPLHFEQPWPAHVPLVPNSPVIADSFNHKRIILAYAPTQATVNNDQLEREEMEKEARQAYKRVHPANRGERRRLQREKDKEVRLNAKLTKNETQ